MRIGFLSVIAAFLISTNLGALEVQDDPNYDRLDGKGPSGKKVHVIEWEGNLEIHVYPMGSLKGLALKLDKRNKDKPVMVIGYRFNDDSEKQLIRRAILGINLKEGFKAYKDPSADEYDKIIISNNGLSDQVMAYKLDPEPSQLYPDGHPALAKTEETKPRSARERKPASEEPDANEVEDGFIKPFSW